MTNWFDFLERLVPSVDSEMTSLVTAYGRPSSDAEKPNMSAELPLDWWIHVSGFIRQRLEELLADRIRARVASGARDLTICLRMKVDPVLRFEIENWLEKNQYRFGALKLNSNSQAWRRENFLASLKSVSEISDARGLHPESLRAEQQIRFSSQVLRIPAAFSHRIDNFIDVMADARVDLGEPPWILWSRFAAWIKRGAVTSNPLEFAELDLRLAFLRAALSPQDEVSERLSLQAGMLMVNPTFEICEGQLEPLTVLARNFDVVVHRPLVELEAQILDQVRESFRLSRSELLKIISAETGVEKEFVNRGVESLIADDFLLYNH